MIPRRPSWSDYATLPACPSKKRPSSAGSRGRVLTSIGPTLVPGFIVSCTDVKHLHIEPIPKKINPHGRIFVGETTHWMRRDIHGRCVMPATPNPARAIFMAALKLAPDQWSAYLEAECGPDKALRDRVENLLTAHREAGSFLEPAAGALLATADGPARDRAGAVIGPYKLLQQIGEGGMA